MVSFLENYAEDHAILLPGRILGYNRSDLQFLPCSTTKRSVWNIYCSATTTVSHVHRVTYTTFNQIKKRIKHCPFLTQLLLQHWKSIAIVFKRRLQTLSAKRVNKRRLSPLEKRPKSRTIMHEETNRWSLHIGTSIAKQVNALSLTISDHEGNLIKRQKLSITKALTSRLSKCGRQTMVINNFPEKWQLECCVIDGMFLINTTPLSSHATFN